MNNLSDALSGDKLTPAKDRSEAELPSSWSSNA
jgi:hypothetical protein